MANQRCSKCGQPVEWITKDGRSIPLHLYGRCGDDYNSSPSLDLTNISLPQKMDSLCWPTKCPVCKESVFFIRHNGGSVWLDELGHPWPKHECMYGEDSGNNIPEPPTPPDFPSTTTQGKILGIEPHGGTLVLFVQWNNKGISVYQCPKQSVLHVNFKLYYDPFDDEKCLRTAKGKAIPLDSTITKKTSTPTLDELQTMITNARTSGTRFAKFLKRKKSYRDKQNRNHKRKDR
jgi:hypothetical protein